MTARYPRLRPPSRFFGGTALLATLLGLGVPAPVAAQAEESPPGDGVRWSWIDAVGYGGVGFGLGTLAIWDLEGDDIGPPPEAVAIVAATTVAGTIAGAMIGRRARRALARGETVRNPHRAAVLWGAVPAGATAGALAAFPLIKGEGTGTFLGSDEQTFTLLVLAGAAVGSVFAWHHRNDFGAGTVNVAPVLFDRGRYGLTVGVGIFHTRPGT